MRVTLRQQAHQGCKVSDTVNRMRRRKETSRSQIQGLNCVIAKMLIEPRPPGRSYAIARLQDWLEARTGSTAYKAEMTAMLARHQFKDGIALPVTLGSEHDAFVSPLHADSRLRPVLLYSFGNSSPMARYRSGSSAQFSLTLTNKNKWTFASAISAMSLRAASPIDLMV